MIPVEHRYSGGPCLGGAKRVTVIFATVCGCRFMSGIVGPSIDDCCVRFEDNLPIDTNNQSRSKSRRRDHDDTV